MSKIQGGELMLFINGKSIAFATNHVLDIDSDTSDFSCKDEGDCGWSNEEIDMLNWSVTSDNVFALNGQGNDYEDLFDLMLERTPIDAVFNKKAEDGCNVPNGGWTPDEKPYKGKVIITDLSLTAQHGEYATFSATFTGYGELLDTAKLNYLWFEPVDKAARFKFTKNQPSDVDIEYSLDSGATWNYLQSGEASPLVAKGSRIWWRGNLGVQTFHWNNDEVLWEDCGIGTFAVTEYDMGTSPAVFKAGGDLNSLLTYDFYKLTTLKDYPYAFMWLFEDSSLTDSSELIFKDIELVRNCYQGLFLRCLSHKKTVDVLPSMTLANYCYASMYSNNPQISKAPELPATILRTGSGQTQGAAFCYDTMFYNCFSLTETPHLVAQKLVQACYNRMFLNCHNLKKVYLDVVNIETDLYQYINTPPFGDTFSGTALCGEFIIKPNATWTSNQTILENMEIPENWVVTTIEHSVDNYDIKLFNYYNNEISQVQYDQERQAIEDAPITIKCYKYGEQILRGNVKVIPSRTHEYSVFSPQYDIIWYDTLGNGTSYTAQITEGTIDASHFEEPIDDGAYIVILEYQTDKPLAWKKFDYATLPL